MQNKIKFSQPAYAMITSLIMLVISTGVIIFEIQYAAHQSKLYDNLSDKLIEQTRDNLVNLK